MYDRRDSAQLDRTTHREASQEPFLPAERGGGGQQLVDETHLRTDSSDLKCVGRLKSN